MIQHLLSRSSVLCSALLLASNAASARQIATIQDLASGLDIPVVDGELVVTIAPGVAPANAALIARSFGIRVQRALDERTFLVQLPSRQTLAAAMRRHDLDYRAHLGRIHNGIRALLSDGRIRLAEPNAILQANGDGVFIPNDTYYPDQWHLAQLDMEHAWYTTLGDEGVKIAILDTGVQWSDRETHFQTAMVDPYDYIDDDEIPDDLNGHGTHTAGIIASRTNDAWGVAGMAPDVSIMPIRVLDANGQGSLDGLIAGLDWAIRHDADVVNMSLSFMPGYYPGSALYEKILEATSANIVLVGSTGNDGVGLISFPAAFDQVLAVGAIDKLGRRANYSNWGSGIDVMAFGGMPEDRDGDGAPDAVLSLSFDKEDPGREIGCWFAAGTSQAAPQVAALAGLIMSLGFEDETAIRSLVAGGCDYIAWPDEITCHSGNAYSFARSRWFKTSSCWNPETGYGLINPHRTLTKLITLCAGAERALGGWIGNYATAKGYYPPGFIGAILEFEDGLLLLLEDPTGLYALVDSGCDSRNFAGEVNNLGDNSYESTCDIAQYLLPSNNIGGFLRLGGGLLNFVDTNAGLQGFLQANGTLLGVIQNNGGLLGMITNNGGLLELMQGNGGIIGLIDVNGGVLGVILGNGGLIGLLENNGALLEVIMGNGGIVGMIESNGGLLGGMTSNGEVIGLSTIEGVPVNGTEQVDLTQWSLWETP